MNKTPVIPKELVEYLEKTELVFLEDFAVVSSPDDIAKLNFNRGKASLVKRLRYLHDKQFEGKVIPDVH